MGDRGHSLHLFSNEAAARLAHLGDAIAVLASSDRWTSFVPLDAAAFDDGDRSRRLEHPLFHVWFDDDHGVVVRVWAAGEFLGELTVPSDIGPRDLDLVATWEELGVITKVERAALLRRIVDSDTAREWAMAHGLERLLGLPAFSALPPDASAAELVALLPPGAIVLGAKKARGAKKPVVAKEPAPEAAAKSTWSDAELRTLDLHRAYFTDVWSMNNARLPALYKKHLPAKMRTRVDALFDAVLEGDSEAIHTRVEGILSRIWQHERWDEIIRDPRLEDGDDDTWQAFRARL